MISFKTTISFLFILLTLLIISNLLAGSVYIPFSELFSIIFDETNSSSKVIFLYYRLPKTITVICVGSGLSVAGLLMQSLFRNALAGPFILGISNGASLGVALFMMFPGVVGVAYFSQFGIVFASIFGATFVFSVVLGISFFLKDNLSLLIVGIMIGSVSGAIVSVLQYFSNAEVIQSYLVWTFGSLGGLAWLNVLVLFTIVSSSLFCCFFMAKSLNAILLGEDYAKGVGVNVVKSKRFIMILTCLLAGVITAYCGPIAFIGLAVPHLARLTCKTSNYVLLLPVTMLIGACLLLLCDSIAQLPTMHQILPINAVTALFGSPVVIWVVIKSRQHNKFS